VQRRPVHGVLLLDKPLGLSSNQALQKAKWLLRAEKAGHTGTLDPLASGVLPLCFGAAAKFSQTQLEADKTYEATIALGVTTTTGDAEGEVVEQRPVPPITAVQLQAVRQRFTGRITQLPPMYSALKKDGKALYEYARDGVKVERAPREVMVFRLDVFSPRPLGGGAEGVRHASDVCGINAAGPHPNLPPEGEGTIFPPSFGEREQSRFTATAQGENKPSLHITATVSKGTYIRTLGEDISAALGCGGHLSRLRRIATGPFGIGQCVTLDALEAMTENQRLACLLPVESLAAGHVRVVLDEQDAGRFLSGLRRRGAWPDAPAVAVFGPPLSGAGQGGAVFLGTAHIQAGELIPARLLNPLEIQQILQQHFSLSTP
jgi:tRNA pseudouridine55 synthase